VLILRSNCSSSDSRGIIDAEELEGIFDVDGDVFEFAIDGR